MILKFSNSARHFSLLTAAISLLFSIPCIAQTNHSAYSNQPRIQITSTVKQVFNDRGKVVAESTALDLKVNDEMVITLENGKQCVLPILEIRGNILTLDSEKCRYSFDIKPGLSLEKSLLSAEIIAPPEIKTTQLPQTPSAKEAEKLNRDLEHEDAKPRKIKILIGAAFSGRTSASGSSGTATGLIGTFNSEFEYKEGFTLSLEMRDSPSHSWGYGVGISFDSTRELEAATFTSGGTTLIASSAGGASKIGSTAFELNSIYRWNEFYIPFGLNYTAIRFTPAAGYTGGFDVAGGFGAQLGFGLQPTESVSFEMISRASTYSLRTIQGTNSANYGNLIFSIITFGIKGHF